MAKGSFGRMAKLPMVLGTVRLRGAVGYSAACRHCKNIKAERKASKVMFRQRKLCDSFRTVTLGDSNHPG